MSWDHFQAPSIFSVTYRSTKPNCTCLILEQATLLGPKISKNFRGFIEVVLYKKWGPWVPRVFVDINSNVNMYSYFDKH